MYIKTTYLSHRHKKKLLGHQARFTIKLCGAPLGDVRLPTKLICGLDFYINGRKFVRFYVRLILVIMAIIVIILYISKMEIVVNRGFRGEVKEEVEFYNLNDVLMRVVD